jgi:hypothetical protein
MKKFLFLSFIIASCSAGPDKAKTDLPGTTTTAAISKAKVISDSTNILTGTTDVLELEYIAWGCACANWITTTDRKKYQDSGLVQHAIFIEPAESSLELPLYFDAFRHTLKLTGQFYVRPGYPKGTVETEEHLEKARIFRYTDIEVENKINFKPESKIETLTLSYNAIACTCAQWSESKFDNDPEKRIHYWLEPFDENLIKADTLFNGENIPLQIQVSGQVVSGNGFPRGQDLSKVGKNETGKVFRYTKISVIKNGLKKSAVHSSR